jgi:hypothetical protein
VKELEAEGYSNVAIGEVLGVDETTVRRDSANAEPGRKNIKKTGDKSAGSSANADPLDVLAGLVADERLRKESRETICSHNLLPNPKHPITLQNVKMRTRLISAAS